MTRDIPLVSIISPCFNMEKYLPRYFDSILAQTYENIELILVDDGSVDTSREVCLSYKKRFEEVGIPFTYLYKENGGAASALNVGLKLFSGKYLIWPDCDDWLEPKSIEVRVNYLESNQSVGIVRGWSNSIDEETMMKTGILKDRMNLDFYEHPIAFWGLLNGGCRVCCMNCMIRTSLFLDLYPNRTIDIGVRGQNVQMLLPMYYNYDMAYIDECCGNVLIRKDSHSRRQRSIDEEIVLLEDYCRLVNNASNIAGINNDDHERLNDFMAHYKFRCLMDLSYKFKDANVRLDGYVELKRHHRPTLKENLMYITVKYRFLHKIYTVLKNDKIWC